MSFEYTTRRGDVYYLQVGPGKKGKTQHYFSKKPPIPPAQPADKVPDGFEVKESVNGMVSLRKKTVPIITSIEMDIVQKALGKLVVDKQYDAEISKNMIIIHEGSGGNVDMSMLNEVLGITNRKPSRSISAYFMPVMRFILIDKTKRQFAVERYCFRGSVEDWIPVDVQGKETFSVFVAKFAKHLGKDSFYELY